jgi:hypothetical protein
MRLHSFVHSGENPFGLSIFGFHWLNNRKEHTACHNGSLESGQWAGEEVLTILFDYQKELQEVVVPQIRQLVVESSRQLRQWDKAMASVRSPLDGAVSSASLAALGFGPKEASGEGTAKMLRLNAELLELLSTRTTDVRRVYARFKEMEVDAKASIAQLRLSLSDLHGLIKSVHGVVSVRDSHKSANSIIDADRAMVAAMEAVLPRLEVLLQEMLGGLEAACSSRCSYSQAAKCLSQNRRISEKPTNFGKDPATCSILDKGYSRKNDGECSGHDYQPSSTKDGHGSIGRDGISSSWLDQQQFSGGRMKTKKDAITVNEPLSPAPQDGETSAILPFNTIRTVENSNGDAKSMRQGRGLDEGRRAPAAGCEADTNMDRCGRCGRCGYTPHGQKVSPLRTRLHPKLVDQLGSPGSEEELSDSWKILHPALMAGFGKSPPRCMPETRLVNSEQLRRDIEITHLKRDINDLVAFDHKALQQNAF